MHCHGYGEERSRECQKLPDASGSTSTVHLILTSIVHVDLVSMSSWCHQSSPSRAKVMTLDRGSVKV